MALPLTRNTTYSPGVPVKAADLNDVQDGIVGAKHGSIAVLYDVIEAGDGGLGTDWAPDTNRSHVATTAAGQATPYLINLDRIPVGSLVTAVRVRVRDDATSLLKFQIRLLSDATVTMGTTSADSDASGTDQFLSVTGESITISTTNRLQITVFQPVGASGTNERRIYFAEVTYHRP